MFIHFFTYLSILFVWQCGFNHLYAQDNNAAMREAEIDFEAAEYGRARSLYESLQEGRLAPWQLATLSYDIGNTFLAQGQYEEALNRYQAAAGQVGISPLFDYRIKVNTAFARLLLAKARVQEIKKKEKASDGDYSSAIFLFNQSLDAIESAKQAACRLQIAEGAKACEPSILLNEMRIEAKIAYAAWLQDYMEFRITHTSLQDGADFLLAGTEATLNHLNFLQEPSMSKEMRGKYLLLFIEEADSWLPLWIAILKGVENEASDDHAKMKGLASQGNKAFSEGIAMMRNEQWEESRHAFDRSMAALNNLLRLAYGNNPIKALLQQLLARYDLVLLQEPMQEVALISLEETQSHLSGILEKSGKEGSEEYLQAQKALASGKSAYEAFKSIQARMWIEDARHSIKRLKNQLFPPAKKIAESILVQSIEMEELALKLNHLKQQALGNEKIDEEAEALLPKVQEQTIGTADKFIEAVLLEQQEAFSQNKQQSSPCQKQPWDEVIPLFTDGLYDAKSAEHSLKNVPDQIKTAANLQNKTIDKWKEALEKLRSFSSEAQKKQEPQQAKEAPQKEPEKKPQEASLNEVLRLIQDMEEDDRSSPRLKDVPVNKGEERPW